MSTECCAGERWKQVKDMCTTCPHAPANMSAAQRLRNGGQPDLADQVDAEIRASYAEGRKDAAEDMASRLIDVWCAEHNKPIPWAKAVEITAIVTKLPDAERLRLLALD